MPYQVEPDQLDAHLSLLRAADAELAERRPDGLTWATYQFDQNRFLDVVSGPHLPEPLNQLPGRSWLCRLTPGAGRRRHRPL